MAERIDGRLVAGDGELITAGFGNQDMLRAFFKRRYGENPPALVFVAGIPSEEGGGTRYWYADGGIVEGRGGGWSWYAQGEQMPGRPGEYDPGRHVVPTSVIDNPEGGR